MDKKDAVKILLAKAIKKQKDIGEAGKKAQERANEAEGAMKSRYDTFKEEGQYLAGGLKIISQELNDAVAALREAVKMNFLKSVDRVSLYTFVTVEYETINTDESSETYFVTPFLGGEKIREDITSIRPGSPLGKALIGKEEGEEFFFDVKVHTNKKSLTSRKGEIVEIR